MDRVEFCQCRVVSVVIIIQYCDVDRCSIDHPVLACLPVYFCIPVRFDLGSAVVIACLSHRIAIALTNTAASLCRDLLLVHLAVVCVLQVVWRWSAVQSRLLSVVNRHHSA